MDVVVYEPPTALAFRVTSGPLRPEVQFRFSPHGHRHRGCLRHRRPLTGVKKAILGSMAERSMTAEAAALDNAKRLLEA